MSTLKGGGHWMEIRTYGRKPDVLAGATPADRASPMIVKLRQPKREIEMPVRAPSTNCSTSLGMNRESYLVIRNGTLAPGDARLDDADVIEVRPVISGG